MLDRNEGESRVNVFFLAVKIINVFNFTLQCDICFEMVVGNFQLPCGSCCCLGCLRTSLSDSFKQLEKHPRTCPLKGDQIYWCPCLGNCAKQISPLLVDGKIFTLFIFGISHAIIMCYTDIMMNLTEPHCNRSCAFWSLWSLRQRRPQAARR